MALDPLPPHLPVLEYQITVFIFKYFISRLKKQDTLICCEDIIKVDFVERKGRARLHEGSLNIHRQIGVERSILTTGNPRLSSISALVIVKESLFNLIIGKGIVAITLTSRVTVLWWFTFDGFGRVTEGER